jgi:hypothetical protein
MAHFAEIDSLQRVIRVLVVDDVDTQDKEDVEVDSIGMKYLNDAFGGTWLRTSYNTEAGVHLKSGTPFRKNYAAAGYTYSTARDAFIPPSPGASWTLNEGTCHWEPPVAYPADGTFDKQYTWNEETTNWKEII